MAKRRRKNRRRRGAGIGVAALMATATALVAVLVAVLLASPMGDAFGRRSQPAAKPESTAPAEPVITLSPTEAPTATPVPTATPTPAPTATPVPTATPAQTGDLPVYKRAETDRKVIAITVDDCYQVSNLQTIISIAHQYGGKLTLFPVGANLSKPGMRDTLQGCVYKLGFEVENHTWGHERIFRLPEQQMAEEIWKQRRALNELLEANYEQHFFRLMGGDGASDQRTHNYLSQLGFKGIAGWSVSGSDSSLDGCKRQLVPGAIYLFHTTDADTRKLRQFIPYAVSQGYRLVTLNELLGYPDNALSELREETMPSPRPYVDDRRTQKTGDYAWNVVLMQDKLRDMGLLVMEGPSTGYYGDQTAEAVAAFQRRVGLNPTGEADAETQRRLLG